MIIYKIVNCVNGKIYIGQTIQKLERRMYSHFNRHTKTCISKAIQKYGKENFKYEIIDTAKTREELDDKEIYWIKYYNSLVPNGYNLELGGNRHKEIHEETREKLRKSHMGEKAPWYGKHLTEETKKKLSEAHKGNPGYWTGKKRDKETIQKMSQNRKGKTIGSTHIQSKKIMCIETGVIYNSIGEASRKTNITRTGIINHLKGLSKSSGGYHWKYI